VPSDGVGHVVLERGNYLGESMAIKAFYLIVFLIYTCLQVEAFQEDASSVELGPHSVPLYHPGLFLLTPTLLFPSPSSRQTRSNNRYFLVEWRVSRGESVTSYTHTQVPISKCWDVEDRGSTWTWR